MTKKYAKLRHNLLLKMNRKEEKKKEICGKEKGREGGERKRVIFISYDIEILN